MRIWCRIIVDQRKVKECTVDIPIQKRAEITGSEEMLLKALSEAAKLLDIERPLVSNKHTKEISEYGLTAFSPSDFMDSVGFDKMTVELIQ
ncbi:MAG TPA: hypothetical protein GXZ61_05175 [Clostridiales bacterium]|jgi:hypothetical protein|nr:hypothetical protein [Clostridiales bacterium]